MTTPIFTLKTATTNANAPFTFGQPFKRGDVPAGSSVIADIADFQCTHKNVWPDGSLKYAVLSGLASLTGSVDKVVTLSVGAATTGTALTTADLKATLAVAEIGAGAFGSVTWATTDWDAPFVTHVSGPKMSSWVYRKPIGTDPHLVAWLRVRLWAGGAVEFLPWVENGFFKVPTPGIKSATFTFLLNTVSKFSQALNFYHHTRTPLINGTHLGYWLGTDPLVTPVHDKAYFQSTEIVPSYRAQPTTASLVTLPSTYAPFQIGGFTYGSDSMPSGGYQRPIGLLPEHDVAFLTCVDNPELLYAALIRNGFSAGRYPIHYRDENTNRIPAFTTHQSTVLGTGSNVTATGDSSTGTRLPANTGGAIAGWDTAHSPALVGAYLATGDWYHLETAQFAVATDWFNIDDINLDDFNTRIRFYPRNGAVQTRQVAWGIRSLAHALLVTPDNDTLVRGELRTLFEQITDFYHQIYIAQPNNPFGIVQLGEYYPVLDAYQATGGTFQQDFMTATFGYAISMGLPISTASAAKLVEFFHWKARSVVGRLGTSSDYWYVNAAAAFYFAVSTVARPDFRGGTGPWPANWKEIYDATLANPGITWESSTEGVLGAEFTSDTWTKGQLANLQPAIAYAVRHGVAGAREGYNRMVGASNFNVLDTGFDTRPVWSVMPYEPQFAAGKTVRCDSISLIPGMVVCGDRGLGLLGSEIIAKAESGEHGPGYGVPSISNDDLNYELRFEIIDPPAGLDADEATRITYAGQTTSFSFRKVKAGVEDGVAVATLNMGLVLVSATFAQAYEVLVNTTPGGGGGGGEVPALTMVGGVTIDLVTYDTIGFSCAPATGGTGTLSYEYSIDGGNTSVSIGTARNVVLGPLPELTAYTVLMRARDQANVASAWVSLTITTLAAPLPVLPDPTPSPTLASRSYAWLKNAVERWSHRSDLGPMMDDFVMLAEKRINGDLEARLQVAATTINTVAKLDGILVPSDVAEIRALSVAGYGSMDYLPPESFYEAAAAGLSGTPRYYTVIGPYLHMFPTPDVVYSLACAYQQKIPPLADEEDGVNWLIRDHPDIYLSAVMCEAMNFTENLAKLPVWEAKYQDAVASLNGTDWHTGTSLCIRSDTTIV